MMTMKRREKSAAIVTIYDAPKMSKKGRRAIAAWLRQQAENLEVDAKLYASRFTARYLYLAIPLLLLAGCGTALAGPGELVVKDLTAARDNLQAAAEAGQLDKTDAALGCLNGVVAQLGAPTIPFKVEGLVSAASVAYVKAQQLKKGGPVVQKDCEALVGQFVLDGAKALLK